MASDKTKTTKPTRMRESTPVEDAPDVQVKAKTRGGEDKDKSKEKDDNIGEPPGSARAGVATQIEEVEAEDMAIDAGTETQADDTWSIISYGSDDMDGLREDGGEPDGMEGVLISPASPVSTTSDSTTSSLSDAPTTLLSPTKAKGPRLIILGSNGTASMFDASEIAGMETPTIRGLPAKTQAAQAAQAVKKKRKAAAIPTRETPASNNKKAKGSRSTADKRIKRVSSFAAQVTEEIRNGVHGTGNIEVQVEADDKAAEEANA